MSTAFSTRPWLSRNRDISQLLSSQQLFIIYPFHTKLRTTAEACIIIFLIMAMSAFCVKHYIFIHFYQHWTML